MVMRFEEAYEKGDRGQRIVNAMLMKSGWTINKTYQQTEEGAPRVFSLESGGVLASAVLPDLDVWKVVGQKWERRWVEVKTKADRDWTKITRRYEHGINRRHWKDYWQIQNGSGFPVYLFVYEEKRNNIIVAKISDLKPVVREYKGTKMGPDGMVFFPADAFLLWGTTGIGELVELSPGARAWIVKP
jgi:hypothetical protein